MNCLTLHVHRTWKSLLFCKPLTALTGTMTKKSLGLWEQGPHRRPRLKGLILDVSGTPKYYEAVRLESTEHRALGLPSNSLEVRMVTFSMHRILIISAATGSIIYVHLTWNFLGRYFGNWTSDVLFPLDFSLIDFNFPFLPSEMDFVGGM